VTGEGIEAHSERKRSNSRNIRNSFPHRKHVYPCPHSEAGNHHWKGAELHHFVDFFVGKGRESKRIWPCSANSFVSEPNLRCWKGELEIQRRYQQSGLTSFWCSLEQKNIDSVPFVAQSEHRIAVSFPHTTQPPDWVEDGEITDAENMLERDW